MDVHHFDAEKAFVQPGIDVEVYMGMLPSCGHMTGRVVLPNKSLCGIKQAVWYWYSFSISTL